jgi:molybdenum cofactor biosynthesis enzyme MoaA
MQNSTKYVKQPIVYMSNLYCMSCTRIELAQGKTNTVCLLQYRAVYCGRRSLATIPTNKITLRNIS